MKKIAIAAVVSLTIVSSAWAAQKNVPTHQNMMDAQALTEAGPGAKPFSALNEHEQAAIVHQFMNNGQSAVHQQEAKKHLQMMQAG